MDRKEVMTDIEWAEPPPLHTGRRSSKPNEEFVAALRANPGRWARYPGQYKRGNSAAATGSRLTAIYPDIEWTSRTEDGHGYVYGRYNPKEAE
jgi:hypothetical protein